MGYLVAGIFEKGFDTGAAKTVQAAMVLGQLMLTHGAAAVAILDADGKSCTLEEFRRRDDSLAKTSGFPGNDNA